MKIKINLFGNAVEIDTSIENEPLVIIDEDTKQRYFVRYENGNISIVRVWRETKHFSSAGPSGERCPSCNGTGRIN